MGDFHRYIKIFLATLPWFQHLAGLYQAETLDKPWVMEPHGDRL